MHELWSVRASLRRPTLDSTQGWQGYLSLQTGGISGVNEVCVQGSHPTKVLSNWRETYYT